MIVAIDALTINLLTEERRIEITVVTESGETIVFSGDEVKAQLRDAGRADDRTMYFYARKTERVPRARVITLIVEQSMGEDSRQRLEITSD